MGTTPSKNPFLLDSSSTTGIVMNNSETLDDIVEKKIQDLINANPFNNGTSGTTGNSSSGSGGGSGNGGKFNTIGRSNPFSSPNTSKNPFLDQKSGFTDQKSSGGLSDQKITSSGEDVNDSPDSSLEPEDHHNGLLHETPSINKIETSFASNQPVTRSLSSVTSNNKSKLPLPTSNGNSNSNVSNQNRINNARKASDLDNVRKASDLERISPWLVSSDAIST